MFTVHCLFECLAVSQLRWRRFVLYLTSIVLGLVGVHIASLPPGSLA